MSTFYSLNFHLYRLIFPIFIKIAKLIVEACKIEQKFMIFKISGLCGDFTLRSIRASTVNELAAVGESNEVIKTRTGHSSDAAVSQYKRPREISTQIRVSNIVTNQARVWKGNDKPWFAISRGTVTIVLAIIVLMQGLFIAFS